jgi:phosphomannomutase
MIAALAAVVALNESGKKLSELADEYHRYANVPEQNFEVADAAAVMAALREKFVDGEQDELDGLTVNYPDWWFNLRVSNTEPVVRLNIEAKDEETLAAKRAEVTAVIEGGKHE